MKASKVERVGLGMGSRVQSCDGNGVLGEKGGDSDGNGGIQGGGVVITIGMVEFKVERVMVMMGMGEFKEEGGDTDGNGVQCAMMAIVMGMEEFQGAGVALVMGLEESRVQGWR